MRRVILLYLPTFPTDRIRKQRAGVYPLDCPLVVTVKVGSHQLVKSVDACARYLGIQKGQPLAEVQARVPNLAIEPSHEEADAIELRSIAEDCIKKYSPLVTIYSPQAIAIDIFGCAHLYQNEENLAAHLLVTIEKMGYACRLGLSDTMGGAYALARYAKNRCSLAPLGSNKESLATLPLRALDLSPTLVESLADLGFYHIGQLYNVARAPLARRFGMELMRRYDQVFGHDYEVFEPIALVDLPFVQCHFSEPVTNVDFLSEALRELIKRLCQNLERSQLGVHQIDMIIERVDNSYQARRVGTSRAHRHREQLTKLLTEKVSTFDFGFGVEKLLLRVPLMSPLAAEQIPNGIHRNYEAEIDSLIDVLRNRLCDDKVYYLESHESDVPERSFRRVKKHSSAKKAAAPLSLSPPRLLKHPLPVQTMAMLPDHSPHYFIWQNNHYRITRADGPERIFGEWWRNDREKELVRDYFRVEDEKGQRFWLFRYGNGEDSRTGDHTWYLHGFFG